MRTKGFKWKGWIKATNQIGHSKPEDWVVFKGNFFMELILPNAFKITSLMKMRDIFERYVKSHNGKYPEQITINKRQFKEYKKLFPRYTTGGKEFTTTSPSFQGIKMVINI